MKHRGSKAYHPATLLALLVYGYSTGVTEALGVSLKWLSDGVGERLIPPEPRRLSREAVQLAELLMCLPEEKQAEAAEQPLTFSLVI